MLVACRGEIVITMDGGIYPARGFSRASITELKLRACRYGVVTISP